MEDRRRRRVVAVLALAGAGLVGALALAGRLARPDGSARPERIPEGGRLRALEEEVASLRAELGRNEPRPAPDSQGTEALRRQVRALEEELARLRGRPEGDDSHSSDLEAAALNSAKSPEERIQALRDLRALGFIPRTVTAGMLELVDRLIEAEPRAQILRLLQGAVPADLRGPVLVHLRADPDPHVRGQAAGALGSLAGINEVRGALEHAALHDPDEGVRAHASESLLRVRLKR